MGEKSGKNNEEGCGRVRGKRRECCAPGEESLAKNVGENVVVILMIEPRGERTWVFLTWVKAVGGGLVKGVKLDILLKPFGKTGE
jgi:hypothetical protein